MACVLGGTPLRPVAGHDIVSDGVTSGSIQAPGHGLPIVLMADRLLMGDSPKIATGIAPSPGRLAQARAGTQIACQKVSLIEAAAARRAEAWFFVERFRSSRWCAPSSGPDVSAG